MLYSLLKWDGKKCWQKSASLLHGWKFSAGPGYKVRTNGIYINVTTPKKLVDGVVTTGKAHACRWIHELAAFTRMTKACFGFYVPYIFFAISPSTRFFGLVFFSMSQHLLGPWWMSRNSLIFFARICGDICALSLTFRRLFVRTFPELHRGKACLSGV
jgi:hypothetical protein